MAKNYILKSGIYLKIDKIDEGFEYWIFSRCKKLIDGGILDNSSLSENDAIKEILKMYNIPEDMKLTLLEYDIEELF